MHLGRHPPETKPYVIVNKVHPAEVEFSDLVGDRFVGKFDSSNSKQPTKKHLHTNQRNNQGTTNQRNSSSWRDDEDAPYVNGQLGHKLPYQGTHLAKTYQAT